MVQILQTNNYFEAMIHRKEKLYTYRGRHTIVHQILKRLARY